MKHSMNYNKNGSIAPKRKYFACMSGCGCYEFDTGEEMRNWVKKAENKISDKLNKPIEPMKRGNLC